jgi:hypothetical protein
MRKILDAHDNERKKALCSYTAPLICDPSFRRWDRPEVYTRDFRAFKL